MPRGTGQRTVQLADHPVGFILAEVGRFRPEPLPEPAEKRQAPDLRLFEFAIESCELRTGLRRAVGGEKVAAGSGETLGHAGVEFGLHQGRRAAVLPEALEEGVFLLVGVRRRIVAAQPLPDPDVGPLLASDVGEPLNWPACARSRR